MRRSALYFGTVTHRRSRPRRHSLRYRVFWTLLDLDELADIHRTIPVFSHNRFNLLSFHDRDHGDGSATPLRAQMDRRLAAGGILLDGGSVLLLAMPRVLGYVFNPISIYFCHYRDGALAAIVYEVHNTFGERHFYLFPSSSGLNAAHSCAKSFHVSPFLSMDMRYRFRSRVPRDTMEVAIVGADRKGPLIAAVMTGDRKPFAAMNLIRAVTLFPLLTSKVIFAIHWNALLLWCKRVPVHRKPPPPPDSITIAGTEVDE